MDNRKTIIFILCCLFLYLYSPAQQVSITLKPNRILIGEQFDLTIRIDAAPNSSVSFPVIADTFNHLEVVRRAEVDSVREGDRVIYTRVLTMTGFEPGQWKIPPIAITVNGKTVKSDSARINIMAVPLRGKDYNDIREIREVEADSINWARILIMLGGVLLILVLAYYWWRRKQKPAAVPVISRSTAYDEAIESLKKLKHEGLDQKGDMKLYYSRLYDIFRLYFSRVSGKPAMQYTTDELLLGTKDMMSPGVFSAVAEVFRISDAVKFARYGSAAEESAASYDRIRQGIDEINRMKK